MKSTILIIAFAILSILNLTNALTCELCELSCSMVEDLVNKNVTESKIIPYLNFECSKLPTKWVDTCQLLVEQYGLEMVELILQKEQPAVVCSQLGLCTENAQQKIKTETETIQNNNKLGFHWRHHHGGFNPMKKLECSACHYAVGKTEKVVNMDINKGKSIVESECNNFEIKEAIHICKRIVDKEIVRIVSELKRHESKENICKHIKMCK